MKYIIKLLYLIAPLVSVSGQILSSSEIVEASINYHDPNRMWATLHKDFEVQGSRDTLWLKLYNDQGMVEWSEKLKDGRLITGGYVLDSCYVKIDEKSIDPRGQIDNFLLDCPQIISRSNYWLYMYGLPMKLKDEQAVIDPNAEKVHFLDREYWRIKVNYNEPEGGQWQFYFDTDTYRFAIAQYFHPAHEDNSEYILFDSPLELEGMLLPARHRWHLFNNREFIGSEELVPVKE